MNRKANCELLTQAFVQMESEAMNEEADFDDGLVHGHRWATEPFRPAPALEQLLTAWPSEEQYDDGLVHDHGWARQEASS
jgi:hypothetical protein